MPVIETKGAASSGGFGQFARQVAANYIEDVFSTYLYTGTGAGSTGNEQNIINGIDLSGKGGLTWIKARTSTSAFNAFYNNHQLYDTARGFTNIISSSTTNGNSNTSTAVTTRSDGFRLASGGSYYGANFLYVTYASWTFRKQAKFFDVVTWTGNGSGNQTISHSLGSTPGVIIVKNLTSGYEWGVYHRSLGSTKYLSLNLTNAALTAPSDLWQPTDTTFRAASYLYNNDNGSSYVAYLFAHDAGGFGAAGTDNVITCGSYTGNGSATGPTVTLGWEPQFVIIKRASDFGFWQIIDNMRGMPAGSADAALQANSSNSENLVEYLSPTATGFQLTSSDAEVNGSSSTYVYIAIRRGPMRTPTSGTSVYNPAFLSSGLWSAGFPIDFAMKAQRTGDTYNSYVADRLRGGNNGLITTQINAEYADPAAYFDNMLGYRPGVGTSTNLIAWMFRRAPGFFDVVCYTGNGTTLTANHNLGVVPEMMIIKRRDTSGNWIVYTATTGVNKVIELNSAYGAQTASFWGTGPTATTFQVQSNVNTGNKFVAYLFASCPGVSKVGSYTGTGTTQQINCGFTGGARFVLIKRTDDNSSGTANWFVWDSARGIVAGNDPYLLLDSTAAEVTSTDYIDTLSTGFEISSTAPAAINANGGSYIFFAIA